jgi:hypothetical protein
LESPNTRTPAGPPAAATPVNPAASKIASTIHRIVIPPWSGQHGAWAVRPQSLAVILVKRADPAVACRRNLRWPSAFTGFHLLPATESAVLRDLSFVVMTFESVPCRMDAIVGAAPEQGPP